MTNIRKILGTMAFGGVLHEAQAHQILTNWIKHGFCEVDTAIMYQDGKTEKIIGKLELSRDPKVKIACKANPLEGFTAADVKKQLTNSLESLKVPYVDIFYLHWPDHNIPIEETLKGVDELHKDGMFNEFGLSNYASWQVVDIYHICKQNGYILPTVYQGMYNALTRDIELELIPALRRFGIRLYVYNPLAGGLLSGKYDLTTPNENQPKGRFFSGGTDGWTTEWTKSYQARYWRNNYKAGAQLIQRVLKDTYNNKLSLLEASISWLLRHSQLTANDGIIVGFSKLEHFQEYLDSCNGEPLDEKVVDAFEEAWNNIKSYCPKYNR